MKNAPVIVVFGYSRDRALFEQAARAAARLVAKGEACAVRLYDDANDPMYPGGNGVPEGVARVETRWDRTGLRTGARAYCEETVRGIVDSLRDAVGATGAEWAVKTDCDAALNSLAFLGGFDPAVYCQVGNEGAPGMSMGVLYAMSAAGLEAVSALLDDRKAQARLVVQDRPEAQSVSLLAQLSGMRRHLVPAGGTVGVGWRHSRHGFVDASPEQMDGMMKCLSVYFKPTMPQATPDEAAAAAYAAALRRMTDYVDALLERGDEMAPKPPPRRWTPLSIKRACGDRWPAVRAALQAADIYEDFVMARELREDDAAFARGYAWAVGQYGAQTVDAVLAAAQM
ncbi:MAG: hypothetical protein IKL96_06795 [Kiritimatiellae bacterium]|nr:hypothetical protein [Kiritimatiellia bacterium]